MVADEEHLRAGIRRRAGDAIQRERAGERGLVDDDELPAARTSRHGSGGWSTISRCSRSGCRDLLRGHVRPRLTARDRRRIRRRRPPPRHRAVRASRRSFRCRRRRQADRPCVRSSTIWLERRDLIRGEHVASTCHCLRVGTTMPWSDAARSCRETGRAAGTRPRAAVGACRQHFAGHGRPTIRRNAGTRAGSRPSPAATVASDAFSAASATSSTAVSRSDAVAKRIGIVWRAASAMRFQCRQVVRFSATAAMTFSPSVAMASRREVGCAHRRHLRIALRQRPAPSASRHCQGPALRVPAIPR